MIDVEVAKKLILENQEIAKKIVVKLEDATGYFLATDVCSTTDLPVFDASAMDGYALCAADAVLASSQQPAGFEVIESIAAGKVPQKKIATRQCARIMTGAIIPQGADCVVMQEDVICEPGKIILTQPVKTGSHIRKRAEELKCGEVIAQAGEKVTPALIGLLASAGVHQVCVYEKPRVTLIPTGSELAQPGESLKPGQIYESNSYALAAALMELGIKAQILPVVEDNEEATVAAIKLALSTSTHVILCGGVSVGDFDYVKPALENCGVQEIFWKVAQKPGKPLYFGKARGVSVFGLPGNPASALVCYYEYVRAALLAQERGLGSRSFSVQSQLQLREHQAKLLVPHMKKKGLCHFVRGIAQEEKGEWQVSLLGQQGSHMMSSFARANCFIVLESAKAEFCVGDYVTIHIVPGTNLTENLCPLKY